MGPFTSLKKIISFLLKFGYRLATLIAPKSRRIKTIQLITTLEVIASLSTDAKWLSWLKYQFTEAMSKNDRIDKNELHVTLNDFIQNFSFKEPFLAHRLFAFLDKDKSGYLSLREFINGLEVVVNGTQEEKMEFLFNVFDVDGNGRIDYNELKMMLKCCLENSPSLDLEETVDDLSALLFKHLDKDDSGDISLEELKNAFKTHYDLYKSLSMSTSIWIKPKFVSKTQNEFALAHRLKHFLANNQAKIIFWSTYILIHMLCMASAYYDYRESNIYIRFARMFGNALNFNCSFILVLVLRKHLTWLRTKGGNSLLPVDDAIEIHKIVGIVILIETLAHTIAHLINIYNEAVAGRVKFLNAMFTDKVSIGFPTGVFELILLVVILVFASSYIRKKGHFQLFYLMHMLTIPWLLIMLVHGPRFWRWLLLPAFCYIVEKVLRYRKVRSNKFGDTFITESYVLPSKVTHLVIRKPSKFHFKPGDYIYINIPTIAKYEWHPFSISSAPENSDYLWLHIKGLGNWTNKLYAYSQSSKFDNNNCSAVSQLSQRSIIRLNMRTKMSNLLNMSLPTSSNNNNELLNVANCNNNIKKVVSFVPESNLLKQQEEKHEEDDKQNKLEDISKISNKEVLFFNNDDTIVNNTPVNAGNSVVPQAQFKEPVGQLRHKSILKVMSINGNNSLKSMDHSPSIEHKSNPTESTPRSLTNVNTCEETKSNLQQFRNRSKSLDNENSFYNTCVNQSGNQKSGSSNHLNTDYFAQNSNLQENKTSKEDLDNFSKNNLILSYENNLSSVVVMNTSDK